MSPFFYKEEAGERGCRPFPLHPQSPPNLPPLRLVPQVRPSFGLTWG